MYVRILALASLLLACGSSQSFGQSEEADKTPPYRAKAVVEPEASPFVGSWSYRSFRSNPDLSVPFNDLRFGTGTLKLSHPTSDTVAGTLGGDGWELKLKGGATYGNPATVRFQGKGVIGDEEWVYDYVGYLVPMWPNGENQRPAIVGTIVRTAAHSDGQAKAGYVAQWIAVQQD